MGTLTREVKDQKNFSVIKDWPWVGKSSLKIGTNNSSLGKDFSISYF